MKDFLFEWYEYLSESVPKIVKGETTVLLRMIENHVNRKHSFTSLRSRSIQGNIFHLFLYGDRAKRNYVGLQRE